MSILDSFEAWVGPNYGSTKVRLLVLGESRYDEDYHDRHIIQGVINGGGKATFTKLVQAVLGRHHSDPEYDAVGFWKRTLFYNYNTSFYPGGPRVPLSQKTRLAPRNQEILCTVLKRYRPTHCIILGKGNWLSISPFLQQSSPYYSITIDQHRTIFSYINHPSVGFRYQDWTGNLSEFLSRES